MGLAFNRGSTPDDRPDLQELPPADQTSLGAATRAVPAPRRLQRPTKHPTRLARRDEICGLDIQRIGKSFEGRTVVKEASFFVGRGEAVALLGPNGAGKTTIFRMITGLIATDGGQIELEGHDITRLPMYRRAQLGIGYVARQAPIFCELDIEQRIRTALEVVEPDRRRREDDLDSLLDDLDIAHLRKTTSSALSIGERLRVEIACSLATRPLYLLLDEPFADVEPTAVENIQSLVRHLTQRGIGVLLTDELNRNPRQTLDVSDRAYVICAGDVLGTLAT